MALGISHQPSRDLAEKRLNSETLLIQLNEFDRALDAHWSRWEKDARMWYAIHAGDQWDKDDELELKAKGKNPVTYNRVDAMISAISGAEITNRQTVRYSPREVGDAQVNELYTGAVEWARDLCDANDEESQAFRDALICGFGVTETRMDYMEDQEGLSKIDRLDPLQFAVDPSWTKPNFVDAAYLRRRKMISRRDKQKLFPMLCAEESYGGAAMNATQPTGHVRAAPGEAYRGGNQTDAAIPHDQTEIIEYQWRETESAVMVINPETGQKLLLTSEEVEKLEAAGLDPVMMLGGVRTFRWTWWRAFRSGDHCFKEPLPDEEFTYKFVTGKIDRNKRLPYGVVRAMVDPQRWSNKFLSQIDFIISANAKGGILYEADAFADPVEAEERWASGDSMIEVTSGALVAGKIQNKPVPPYPQGIDRLFQISVAALPEVVGVNKEMLGTADQVQAGVLEYQRKQAAYGVLAIFFDSLRRYRKIQGRLHLKLIAKYMSDGRLIRITNPESGKQQYVPLLHDPEALKFDVVVDEAPAGPNQKERVWQMLMGLGQVMQSLQNLPPDMILAVMEYSPLPTSLIDKLREMMAKAQTPEAQQLAQAQQQLQVQGTQAQLKKLLAEASLSEAQAQKAAAEAALVPQRLQLEQAKVQTDATVAQGRLHLDFTRLQAETGLKMTEIERSEIVRVEDRDARRQEREEERADAFEVLSTPGGGRNAKVGPYSDQILLFARRAQSDHGEAGRSADCAHRDCP